LGLKGLEGKSKGKRKEIERGKEGEGGVNKGSKRGEREIARRKGGGGRKVK